MSKKKEILITGGNGFIAKNLHEQLNGTYAISSLSHKELDLFDAEKVLNYLKKNRFDVVMHTATYDAAPIHSTKDPTKVLENNLKMFFSLVRGRDYFGKMLYFGSGAEYGRENWIPKMKEDYYGQHVPSDQYGFSKYLMTSYAQSSDNIYNLRLFAVFGKYEDWRVRIISNVCHNVALGLPVTVKQNKCFDFLYIDDLVKIVSWFIENDPKYRVYNVCSGKAVDFKAIAKKVIAMSGKKLDLIVREENLKLEYSGDNTRLMSELDSFQFTPLDTSVKALYDWYVSRSETGTERLDKIINDDLAFIARSRLDWNKFKNKTILVTGAYGMLLSYITFALLYLNELDPKFNVTVIALVRDLAKAKERFGYLAENDHLKFLQHDLLSPLEIADEVDYIIHGASYASPHHFKTNPTGVLQPNTIGTYHLLELAKQKKVNGFLFFSSGAVYGKNEKEVVTEGDYGYLDPLDLISCYSESKKVAENICKSYYYQFGIPAKIVRPAHIYGPTMDIVNDSRVFANFVSNVINGKNLVMKSNGTAKRSFCYIADATVAFLKVLLDGKDGEAYNVGNDDAYLTINELAEIFITTLPERKIKVIKDFKSGPKNQDKRENKMLMSSKKVERLGWKCAFSIPEGLRRTVESFSLQKQRMS